MPLFGKPGERIAYTVYPGPPGAPPILLLHGFTASKASFLSNIDDLRREFTVVAIELLGHGDSDAPEDSAPYAPGPAVERITGLIEQLGYDQVLLCGHSLGGAVALRVALDAPEYVAGVVVINSNSAAGDPEWRERARASLGALAARARDEGTGFLRGSRLYPAASRHLPPDAREALAAAFDRLSPAGFAGTAEALSADVNAWERLGDLSVPLLLIIGDRDTGFVRNAPAFLEQLPADLAQWVTISGAGHAANLERPALFFEAVREFATQVSYLRGDEAPAAPPRPLRGTVLTALGAVLIAVGVALFIAAFLVGGDGPGEQFPAVVDLPDDPTATAVEGVAGDRTRGPGPATTPDLPTPASTSTAAASPAGASTAATPSPTTAPPDTPVPQATQPVLPADPTSTPEPTETPTDVPPTLTPIPSGPFAAISGPAPAGINQTVYLSDASQGAPFRVQWAGCKSGQVEASCEFSQPTEACYAVQLTAYYADPPASLTAVHYIAVGTATCGN